MTEGSAFDERRSEERQRVAWHGRLSLAEGQEPCEVLNISCNGVQVSTARPLQLQSEISLDIDHLGGFSGTVVWREGDRYGVQFACHSALISHFLGCWTSFENLPRDRQI